MHSELIGFLSAHGEHCDCFCFYWLRGENAHGGERERERRGCDGWERSLFHGMTSKAHKLCTISCYTRHLVDPLLYTNIYP